MRLRSVLLCVGWFVSAGAAVEVAGPVGKVVTLLKDMETQLEQEQKDDEKAYERYKCWCKTNEEEKTSAIAEAEAKIEVLAERVKELIAKVAGLKVEIGSLAGKIEENIAALRSATEIREKEAKEFHENSIDDIQNLESVKGAITVLEKHGSLTQTEMTGLRSLASKRGFPELMMIQRRALTSFLQQPMFQSYSGQSGEIVGVLKGMSDTIKENMGDAYKAEQAAINTFQDLKQAKETEIAVQKKSLNDKKVDMTTSQQQSADDQKDYKQTQETLKEDQAFLQNVRSQCSDMEKEWTVRSKERHDEIMAVNEAIKILSDDSARDTFSRATSFLELKAIRMNISDEQRRRDAATKVLTKVKGASAALVALSVKKASMEKVITKIDAMVKNLKQEQTLEAEERESCVTDLNDNEKTTQQTEFEREEFQAKMQDLEVVMANLTKDTDQLKKEVAEMQVQLQAAANTRTSEDKESQQVVSDQKATQAILQKAINRMEEFYKSKQQAALVQKSKGDEDNKAPELKSYDRQGGAHGVIGLMNQIIADSKLVEDEAVHNAQTAWKAYGEFVAESNAGIVSRQREIVSKTAQLGDAKQSYEFNKKSLMDTVKELGTLNEVLKALHVKCDFLIKNFDISQQGRSDEINALGEAKNILLGMK